MLDEMNAMDDRGAVVSDEEADSVAEWELRQRWIWAREAGLDARTADLLALRAELDTRLDADLARLAASGSGPERGHDAAA